MVDLEALLPPLLLSRKWSSLKANHFTSMIRQQGVVPFLCTKNPKRWTWADCTGLPAKFFNFPPLSLQWGSTFSSVMEFPAENGGFEAKPPDPRNSTHSTAHGEQAVWVPVGDSGAALRSQYQHQTFSEHLQFMKPYETSGHNKDRCSQESPHLSKLPFLLFSCLFN